MKIVSMTLICLLIGAFPSFGGEETPEEAVKIIFTLFKNREFVQLIRERYTEIYKAEKAGKVADLIEDFSKRYANEEKLKNITVFFESLLDIKPNIAINSAPRVTETEKMAIFPLKDSEFKLYLQKSGKWGFHM